MSTPNVHKKYSYLWRMKMQYQHDFSTPIHIKHLKDPVSTAWIVVHGHQWKYQADCFYEDVAARPFSPSSMSARNSSNTCSAVSTTDYTNWHNRLQLCILLWIHFFWNWTFKELSILPWYAFCLVRATRNELWRFSAVFG